MQRLKREFLPNVKTSKDVLFNIKTKDLYYKFDSIQKTGGRLMDTKNVLSNIKTKNGIIIDILFLIGFIGIGTLGRYLLFGMGVQPFPNFEIMTVITFMAAFFLRPSIAFAVPLFSMILSDVLIGNPIFVGHQMNRIILFTYSGFALISVFSIFRRDWFKKGLGEMRLKNIGFAAGAGIGLILIYDVWTNLGWWYLMYPHTAGSLATVFTLGIPFMIYHAIAGVFTFVAIALPIVSYVSNQNKLELPRINIKHKLPIIAISIILIGLSFVGTATQIPQSNEAWLENSDDSSVKIVISAENWIVEDNIFVLEGDTVLTLLEKCSDRNDFEFKSTYHEQYDSVLIDSINDITGYWAYYVNGEIIWESCDKHQVNNGDIIEWRIS
jgi:hypothetical protein